MVPSVSSKRVAKRQEQGGMGMCRRRQAVAAVQRRAAMPLGCPGWFLGPVLPPDIVRTQTGAACYCNFWWRIPITLVHPLKLWT